MDLSTNRVYIARNVIFDETLFPFSHLSAAPHSVNTSSTHVPLPSIPQPISNSPPNLVPHNTPSTSTPTASPSSTPSLPYSTNVNMQIPCPAERLNQHPMLTRSRANIVKPKQLYPGIIKYPLPKALFVVNTANTTKPNCFIEASKSPEWRATMNTEFTALLKNGTWNLVPPKSHTNVVGCKWVFRIKRNADGSLARHKACLVAKGFHQ